LDFAHNGHQGATTVCMRWFLKSTYLYLILCQIAETCH